MPVTRKGAGSDLPPRIFLKKKKNKNCQWIEISPPVPIMNHNLNLFM